MLTASLFQINTDAEDESLVRYKQQLGLTANADSVAAFPDDKRTVIVKQLTLLVPDKEDKVLDLTMPLEEIKKQVLQRIMLRFFRSYYWITCRNSCSRKAASSRSKSTFMCNVI